MAKKPNLKTITSGYAATTALNENFEALRDALDNTVSRDGSVPNSMSADLDMNSQDILNVNSINTSSMILNGTLVIPSDVDPVFDGTVSTLGANLIDDLTGDDMLDTLGLTASVSELNYSYGVTSSIQTQLNNLTTSVNGKQAESDILTDLAGLSQATNKIPYFDTSTTAGTLDFKDEDDFVSDSATAVPSQQSVKSYVGTSINTMGGNQSGSAPVYAARAWANCDGNSGASPTIRAGGNIASFVRTATGRYTVTFTTSMSDANYCVNLTGGHSSSSSTQQKNAYAYNLSTTGFDINVSDATSNSDTDAPYMMITVFR